MYEFNSHKFVLTKIDNVTIVFSGQYCICSMALAYSEVCDSRYSRKLLKDLPRKFLLYYHSINGS